MWLFIILILAGAYILVKGKINFSKDRELVKPNSIFIGLVLIGVAFIMYFLKLDIFVAGGMAVLTLIVAYFLSDKVSISASAAVNNRKQNLIKFIVLIIFAALVAFAFWYFTKI